MWEVVMAQSGRLVQWNDDRGFGFVEGADGQRLFVHVSSIDRIATRPRVNDSVTFVPGRGPDGRPQARSVRILGANPAPAAAVRRRGSVERREALDWRIPAAFVLALLLLAGLVLERIGWPVVLAYGGMGLVSFLAYRADKTFAETGHWRISEVTLLALDLCLGVIGGLLGQALSRHKTRKQSYVAATVLITMVHLLWLVGFASGLIDAGDILSLVTTLAGE
jgi:uncharacterized membrane protein YsdA (DUF1294 family)/cold shock CspA family protein